VKTIDHNTLRIIIAIILVYKSRGRGEESCRDGRACLGPCEGRGKEGAGPTFK